MKSVEFPVQVFGSHAVYIPVEHGDPFSEKGKGRVLIHARHEDRRIRFHAALQKRKGRYVITFSKDKQKELQLLPGDQFYVSLEEDSSKYGVEMPEEMKAVLETDPEAESIFESLTDGRKRSLIYMILKFKNSQTRIDKSLILSENLKRGLRDPKMLLKPL